MSKKLNPKNINSAISSWSGFVYQGKVALYHVVKLLTKSPETASYTLQLDSLEDFAVFEKGNIKSIHQVKALKSKPNCPLNKIDDLITEAISELHRINKPAYLNPDYALKSYLNYTS